MVSNSVLAGALWVTCLNDSWRFVAVYAAYCISPEQMFTPLAWNSDECINYGTLFLGLFMRILFMAGIGRKWRNLVRLRRVYEQLRDGISMFMRPLCSMSLIEEWWLDSNNCELKENKLEDKSKMCTKEYFNQIAYRSQLSLTCALPHHTSEYPDKWKTLEDREKWKFAQVIVKWVRHIDWRKFKTQELALLGSQSLSPESNCLKGVEL